MQGNRHLNRLTRTVRTFLSILSSQEYGPRRRQVLTAFTKIKLTRVRGLLKRDRDSREHALNIMGYRISFLSDALIDSLFEEIFVKMTYGVKFETDSPLIIDCGSNIGMSILFFKTLYPRARVIGFEPGDKAFKTLAQNVSGNALTDVDLHKKAVSDTEGEANFFYDADEPEFVNMSLIESEQKHTGRDVRQVRVESVLLSTYIGPRVDLLKLDVEGAETRVIRDLFRTGKLKNIGQMIIEYHHHFKSDDDELSEMLRLLEEGGFGYQIESVLDRPYERNRAQDVLVYAYRKGPAIPALEHDRSLR